MLFTAYSRGWAKIAIIHIFKLISHIIFQLFAVSLETDANSDQNPQSVVMILFSNHVENSRTG